ncbi:MAG: glycosyltransferase family 39 protein [Flavobacteriales bacterium]
MSGELLGIPASGWVTISGYVLLPLAWWWHRRGDDRWAVATLVLCAGLLRLGPSLDPCLHEWDERYHALVAKHLLEHPMKPTLYEHADTPHGDASWATAHVWLNKPPLSLWAITLSLKCFGMAPWAVRLPSVFLSALAVALLYSLARTLSSRTAAFWAAFLFCIQGHLIELASGRTSNDHPDTFLVVFVLAALLAAVRMARSGSLRWAVGCGVLAGLAFLSKSWPALVIVPVTFLFLRGQGEVPMKRSIQCTGVMLLAMLCVALPWTIYSNLAFAEEAAISSAAHWRHFTADIEAHGRPWTYYWSQLPMIHGEFAPLALIWFIAVPFRKRPREYAALLVWLLLPYIVFSFALTKMPGYTALAAPAMCIILAMAIEQWCVPSLHPKILRAVALVGALGLVLLPLRFSLDRTRPWVVPEQRYVIPPQLMSASARTIVTGCPFPIELMFHTPIAAAYAEDLEPLMRGALEEQGYRIVGFKDH